MKILHHNYHITTPKFKYPNLLAEEALNELRQKIAESSFSQLANPPQNINPEDVIVVYAVTDELKWDDRFIIVKKGREVVVDLFTANRTLQSLSKEEWSLVLNPNPPNLLLFHYFKKLHNAFKTKAKTSRAYSSAFEELESILQRNWDSH